MNTERRARNDAGFTLIEVLIAMVILAIGLLAVEALGIGAARSVQRARVQSAYSALASDVLEQTLVTINQDPTATLSNLDYNVTTAGVTRGAHVWRGATKEAVAGTTAPGRTGNLNLWTVVVSVVPPSGSTVIRASDSVHVESNVIR